MLADEKLSGSADGMNLIAKEYIASQVNHSAVLILSEFAAAAFHRMRSQVETNNLDDGESSFVSM